MSVRQDNENKNCPSRGLGIAAAAIGVGVGAALYYFFSKREDPDTSGATSSWRCEREHALSTSSDSSFTTISEHSTTDTSINSSASDHFEASFNGTNTSFTETSDIETSSRSSSMEFSESSDESQTGSDHDFVTEMETDETQSFMEAEIQADYENRYMTRLFVSRNARSNFSRGSSVNHSVDSETNQAWDVTNSSQDIPFDEPWPSSGGVLSLFPNLLAIRQSLIGIKRKKSRERTWSPEECSICFDMMTQTQEVMSLPCTHRFHQACILPWLQEKQTCPNCRKTA